MEQPFSSPIRISGSLTVRPGVKFNPIGPKIIPITAKDTIDVLYAFTIAEASGAFQSSGHNDSFEAETGLDSTRSLPRPQQNNSTE